jgi:flagellar biosynthesis/type III secretory pathway protein FliH
MNKGSTKGRKIMRLTNLKKLAMTGALGVVAILGTTQVSNAQTYRDWQRTQRQVEKQERRADRQQQRAQRQYERRMYRLNNQYGYYQTDERGIQILREAVNRGYQQGFYAGQTGRRNGNGYGYNGISSYRNGTYGYNSYVNSQQYRYYFQQGFQRGYEDGYNSRYQYGYRSGNGINILGSILSSILNFSSY